MPNDLTVLMRTILAQAHMHLRKSLKLTQFVNRDFDLEAKEVGATIDVPIYPANPATAVVPAEVPPAPKSLTPSKVQIALDQHYKGDFHLTDKQKREITVARHLPKCIEVTVDGIAQQVNTSLFEEYKGVYTYVGTAGTTPFASDPNVLNDLDLAMTTALCPKAGRQLFLDAQAVKNAKGLAAFQDASKFGGSQVIRKGELGEVLGFNSEFDHDVPLHSSTAFSAGACTVNGAHAVGAGSTDGGRTGTVSLAKATNTSPLVKGDIISFASDTQTYVVLADVTLAVGNTTVSIAPALKVAKSGAEAVTLRATHRVNLAMTKDAMTFVSRPVLIDETDRAVAVVESIPDPLTGIVLSLEITRQHFQTAWWLSCLWGRKLVRPELAGRLAG